MNFEPSKAISQKRLMGTSFPKPQKGQTIWLYAVVGVVVSVENGVGDKGEWTRFNGDFRAVTLIPVGRDKEIRALTGSQLFLPTVAEEKLLEAGAGEEGKFSAIAMKIGVTADDKSQARGVVEWLKEPEQTSPAEALVEVLENATNAPATETKGAQTLHKPGKK